MVKTWVGDGEEKISVGAVGAGCLGRIYPIWLLHILLDEMASHGYRGVF